MVTLIAGGAGFVGSHLCKRLLSEGHEVVCLDNVVTGRRGNIEPFSGAPGFTFVRHDITRELPPLPRVDHVYHLASPASPPAYQRRPVETLRVNSEGTLRLLDLADRDGARFLYASTSEVYGDPLEHPQREEYNGNVSCTGPRSMYDEGKRYGEALTMAYHTSRGVDSRIVRIFNTYGPRMDPADGRVVTNLVTQALREEPLTVYGDGSQTRSLQYVDDLIEALVRLMRADYHEPVNVGNPEEYTMVELASIVKELAGSSSPVTHEPLPGDDPKQRRPDITRARQLLDWEPQVPLREGLRRTIEYLRGALEGTDNLSRRVPSLPESMRYSGYE